MMKILIAADGSDFSRAAARYVASQAGLLKERPQVSIIHVHAALPVTKSISRKSIDEYYREESLKALAVAEKELEKSGTGFDSTWCVGDAAEEIARYATEKKIDLIVTGSHGLGALARLAMGSVTTKLVALSKIPVLVIPKG
jgi:nucleotide-binding universal stress UspA family protein